MAIIYTIFVFHENMFSEIIKCLFNYTSLPKQHEFGRSNVLNSTLQGLGNSIFILHSFNINTVCDSTQYSSHKRVSLSSLVMLEN